MELLKTTYVQVCLRLQGVKRVTIKTYKRNCVYQIPILAPCKAIFSHDFKIFHPSCIVLIPIYGPYFLQSNNEPSPMNYVLAIGHNF